MTKKINELPPSMAERAVTARKIACKYPKNIDVDDQMLPWVFDTKSGLWLSFDGNYSKNSPAVKRQYQLDQEQKQNEYQEKAIKQEAERYAKIEYWSKIRSTVLQRDAFTCQLCGVSARSKLHIHHILKRVDGGTDHYDNLITVCPKCHALADKRLYNPKWDERPWEH